MRVNVLLCTNVTFWNEWQVRSRIFLEHLEHFHALFYVGSYRVGIGYSLYTVCCLHFLFKLLSTETEFEWTDWTKKGKGKGTRKSHDNLIFRFWFLFIICFGIPQSISMLNWKRKSFRSLKSLLGLFEVKMDILDLVSPSISFYMDRWMKESVGHVDRNIWTNWQWKWQIEPNQTKAK